MARTLLRPTAPLPPLPAVLPSVHRSPTGDVLTDLTPEALRRVVQAGEGVLWLDLDVSNPAQAALLTDVFHFHPLAVEDARNPESRVKVDEYPDFLVIIARVVGFADHTPDPYDLDTTNLAIFITANTVITAHTKRSPVVELLTERLHTNPDLLDRGPARVAHQALDIAVDAYFPLLNQLDEFVDDIEQRVFGHFDEQLLHEIFQVKRLVISLRRFLAPQREVLSQLTNRPSRFLPIDAQLYFRDVYDHMMRIMDALDSYRDLMSSTLDSYLTQVSNRLGSVSKGLAMVGALSVPFVVIAGVYGMNFEYIPLAKHVYGFEIMVGIQFLVAGLLLLGMRWKKMI
ncbi:MAG: magnesium transporter CorA family protein [Cytophagaceae bacterium]|nr:magnesium transporter CorA family protein [Gemmatimonadaceae bacterium]